MVLMPPVAEMYRALVERDQQFEGLFFACVRTTGIFCRPTCPARKPKPENVEFAASVQDALLRGFRPCRVCHPVAATPGDPAWLTPLLAEIARTPDCRLRDEHLQDRGLDPVAVRRVFKRKFGMTFQAYQRACRLGSAMKALKDGAPTLDAGLSAGFESDSGFRAAFERVFGAAPGQAKGSADHSYASWMETPLGPMIAVASDEGLQLLEFVDRRALETELGDLRRRIGGPIVPGDHPVLTATTQQMAEYFAGSRQIFDIPLKQRGSPFQHRVWTALQTIPYGETTSYAEIARRVEAPKAVRAVGTANGRNPLTIIVPCHRVVASDGTLCGYGGGKWRKQWLLDHERNHR